MVNLTKLEVIRRRMTGQDGNYPASNIRQKSEHRDGPPHPAIKRQPIEEDVEQSEERALDAPENRPKDTDYCELGVRVMLDMVDEVRTFRLMQYVV